MTPKLRLRLDDKKVLLSWMRKLRWPGIRWMIKSTQMMLDPTMQADDEDQSSASEAAITSARSVLTQPAYTAHYPPSGIIVQSHRASLLSGRDLKLCADRYLQFSNTREIMFSMCTSLSS